MKAKYKVVYFLILIFSSSISWGQDCDEGYVLDCSGDGDCCPESWIGDGFCDGQDQTWGCDLICYEAEWDDCGANFPQIYVYPEQIFQQLNQGNSETIILTIVNNGLANLEWFISNQNDISNWLSLDTYSGFLEPGTLEEVYVILNSSGLDGDEYNTDIFISSNDPFNEEVMISVTMIVFNGCFDLSGIDFGECDMVLGVGWNGYECEYFSGCDWIVDNIDYSDYFFDSWQECEGSCQCEDGDIIDDNPCNPMECFDGQWYEIIIDCAEDMGMPCEGGLYIPPEEEECCSECIQFGDINYDYALNILDVIQIVITILDGDYNEIADINFDGIINILDVIEIIDIILD